MVFARAVTGIEEEGLTGNMVTVTGKCQRAAGGITSIRIRDIIL